MLVLPEENITFFQWILSYQIWCKFLVAFLTFYLILKLLMFMSILPWTVNPEGTKNELVFLLSKLSRKRKVNSINWTSKWDFFYSSKLKLTFSFASLLFFPLTDPLHPTSSRPTTLSSMPMGYAHMQVNERFLPTRSKVLFVKEHAFPACSWLGPC